MAPVGVRADSGKCRALGQPDRRGNDLGGEKMTGIREPADLHCINSISGRHWPGKGTWGLVSVLAVGLSGCGLLSVDNASSGFASVSGGQVNKQPDGKTNRTVSDPAVGTVAFATGYALKNGFLYPSVTSLAYAGIAPGYDVGSKVTGGTAVYHAKYAYDTIDYETSFFGLSGRPRTSYGYIDLTANFGTGTLTGVDPDLEVDGTINGSKLSGSVTLPYTKPIGGVLTGYIGSTGTIGAFHGSDSETAFAGGFVGPAP